MMKILLRNNKNEDWKIVDSADYRAETELQKLLADTPALIAINEIRPTASSLIIAVRECGLPGSGNTDILAFSADGDIAVVECKLAANTEIKRKVVGRILEYGAYLWKMSYDDLNQLVANRRNKDLADLVQEAVGDPEWDEENFRTTVTQNLAIGNFILVIAVDEINDELNRTINFLNQCGNPAFSFAALEMRRFQSGKAEILVPNVTGAAQPSSSTRNSIRKRWNEEAFFETVEIALPPDQVAIIRKIYQWSKREADRVQWGTGSEKGSFTYHYLKDGETVSVFTINTKGYLYVNFGYLESVIPKDTLQKLRDELSKIPTLSDFKSDPRYYPTKTIEKAFLNNPECLEQFEAWVKDVQKLL